MALVRRGKIGTEGIFEDLALIEGLRTTGRLKFRSGTTKGSVALVNGQLAAVQPNESHLETLLTLKKGEYQLLQELPPLPVSTGDAEERRGSLEVHVAADVMNYCEGAGLTGTLSYQQGSAKAEVRYDAGEMHTIRLTGLEDLHEVFAWEQGSFVIQVALGSANAEEPSSKEPNAKEESSEPPRSKGPTAEASNAQTPSSPLSEAPTQKLNAIREEHRIPARRPREDEATIEMALPPIFPTSDLPPMRPEATVVPSHLPGTGQHLLRIVEMSLAEIGTEREERRPATRTSPPLPPLEPRDTPLPRKRSDQTVRILVLADPEDDIPTQKRNAVTSGAAAKVLNKTPRTHPSGAAKPDPRESPKATQGDQVHGATDAAPAQTDREALTPKASGPTNSAPTNQGDSPSPTPPDAVSPGQVSPGQVSPRATSQGPASQDPAFQGPVLKKAPNHSLLPIALGVAILASGALLLAIFLA